MEPAPALTTHPESSIFEDSYYKEVQEDIWAHDRKKTKRSIMIIGAIMFGNDFLSLLAAGRMDMASIPYIVFFPLIFIGIAFFARARPLQGMALAALLYAVIIALTVYVQGVAGLAGGWMIKAVLVFLIILGFRHARSAEKARKNLEALA